MCISRHPVIPDILIQVSDRSQRIPGRRILRIREISFFIVRFNSKAQTVSLSDYRRVAITFLIKSSWHIMSDRYFFSGVIFIMRPQREPTISILFDHFFLLEENNTQIITYIFSSSTQANLVIPDGIKPENLVKPISAFL